MSEQKCQNESNLDMPEARITAPKTITELIGEIKDATDFIRLLGMW
jgi:hypothetical protein